MKRITYLTFALMLFFGAVSLAQHSRSKDPIRLVQPRNVPTTNCQLHYSLVGPFGGYAGLRRGLDASELVIETVHDGQAADQLKAILYCSGYQIETVALDSLRSLDDRNIRVNPKPLGTIDFHGVVRGWIAPSSQVLYVDVDYTPWWVCEFFVWPDCALSWWRVGSVKIETDGTFSTTLPDFARDPVIGSFKNPGEFAFRIRDQKTGNPLFELKPAGSNSLLRRVPVANDYPGEQVFDAELPK